jgi:hypothetical protein
VIMETNAKSFHSVNEIVSPRERRCVSNYFFSPISPNTVEKEHVTYFRGRPEDLMSRILLRADSDLRSIIRKAKKSGLSRSDTYSGPVEIVIALVDGSERVAFQDKSGPR